MVVGSAFELGSLEIIESSFMSSDSLLPRVEGNDDVGGTVLGAVLGIIENNESSCFLGFKKGFASTVAGINGLLAVLARKGFDAIGMSFPTDLVSSGFFSSIIGVFV